MKRANPTTRILFNRTELKEVCRYTSVALVHVGDLWVEAHSTEADMGTFRLNNWHFRII